MSKTKKIISLLMIVALIMTMATVAIVSTSAAAKVYFEDSENWGNIHAYCYGGSAGEELGTWPGTACTDEGNGIWSVELNADPEVIIFNDGKSEGALQTSNIPYAGDAMIAKLTGEWVQGDYSMVAEAVFESYSDAPVDTTTAPAEDVTTAPADDVTTAPADDVPVVGDGTTVYFTNNWAFTTQNLYYWGTDADPKWPGVAMTFVETNENGEDIYTAVVPAGATGIVFNGQHDQDPTVTRQTVDITEFANNTGYYCVEEVDGKITVGTYEYAGGTEPVPSSTATVEPTPSSTAAVEPTPSSTAAVEPTPSSTAAVEPTPSSTAAVEPTPSSTAAVEPTPSSTAAVEPTPTEKGVEVDGTTYDVTVGDTLTYTVTLTAAELFENVQAVVTYDAAKLELVRKGDDEVYEEEIACPVLGDAIFNADVAGVVKFNASKVKGYNFKEGGVLVTLDFIVLDDAKSAIDLTIEEMTIKGDGTQSYFAGGQAVITDGISVVETLTGGTSTSATTTDAPKPTTTTTDAPKPTATTTEAPKPTATTTEAPKPTATPGAPEVDPTNIVGTEGTTGSSDPVGTGAAAYIYIVIAIMAMTACAVVVLRKKVNG